MSILILFNNIFTENFRNFVGPVLTEWLSVNLNVPV